MLDSSRGQARPQGDPLQCSGLTDEEDPGFARVCFLFDAEIYLVRKYVVTAYLRARLCLGCIPASLGMTSQLIIDK